MSFRQIKDQDLVTQYINGDENAFEVLLKRHRNRIYTQIYLMVRDRDLAEDLFQDTFIKIIQTLKGGRYNEEGKFLPWALRISHNLVIDHFRRSSKMKKVTGKDDFDIFSVLPLEEENVEDVWIREQIYADLGGLIEELPDEQKEVVRLRHYNELSFKEIAEKTGVSINTALGRMRYALINLRKIMEEKGVSLTLS
ncbi:MAG: RNA polymerase sigma factor (sigma-70 family) [Sphingobacteriales bacterium]|jgi:RNA polymerase sigma factor (sigma-70 family)